MSVTASITTSENQNANAFAFQNISRKSNTGSQDLGVMNVLEMCAMINVTDSAKFDFPNFPEARKTFHAVYFQINESYSSLKGLFRGLASLGKPEGVVLEYVSENETFTLKFYASNEQLTKAYLNKIIKSIEDEIRFKSILNQIIENQRIIKAEQSLLLQKLFA
ncbi:hypothetical protein MM213_13400 [Belliella sp. R4-6]|uniref:Uncharacterized protein n=1 Tax=Belliella alkalica TaxID=1730871 RepID=A0ABS9VE86_9BACT|nr:hypothetical protein [Belliella alkalica]MCH7414489.1 hypothetical protein [Belliella alkalica]